MTQTITKGATTITPDLILGYEASTDARTITHTLLSGADSYSIAADSPRSGTLELFFKVEADAWAARQLHLTTGVLAFADTEHASLAMSYVRDGQMKISLDSQTRTRWILSVGYREVLG